MRSVQINVSSPLRYPLQTSIQVCDLLEGVVESEIVMVDISGSNKCSNKCMCVWKTGLDICMNCKIKSLEV